MILYFNSCNPTLLLWRRKIDLLRDVVIDLIFLLIFFHATITNLDGVLLEYLIKTIITWKMLFHQIL